MAQQPRSKNIVLPPATCCFLFTYKLNAVGRQTELQTVSLSNCRYFSLCNNLIAFTFRIISYAKPVYSTRIECLRNTIYRKKKYKERTIEGINSLIYISELPSYNVLQDTYYSSWGFSCFFLSHSRQQPRYLKLGQNRFLPHGFQIINRYVISLSYWQLRSKV
jgi:hypothetical protein